MRRLANLCRYFPMFLIAACSELIPYQPALPVPTSPPPTCSFTSLVLPSDFRVFATGAYSGRTLQWQIDQSGHAATQIDVAVNNPAQPVVLALGAYEPTIWNIGWTNDTRVLAVLVSGYHRQALAGLDPKVPTINSSYDNRGPCGYFYLGSSEPGLEKLNTLSRQLFGRPVDRVFPSHDGATMVGEYTDAPFVTHRGTRPESFQDPKAPLAGPAGLQKAVLDGQLRPATRADAQAWIDAVAANAAKKGRTGAGPLSPDSFLFNAYVVLKEFTAPAGLYGAHSAMFFVPKGVPRPTGELGHSAVYDFNVLTCDGARCGGD